jgi:hypothetical protein
MAQRDHGWVSGTAARRRAACILGGLAFALAASTAGANGRFPRAQRLIQDQQNPDVMALYGTYGLLITRDAGASWRHVCEAATGAYAGEDSLLEIMADERIVLRTDSGLARSDASFCGYDAVLGGTTEALQDITRDSAGPNALLALSTSLRDDGVFVSSLSSSTDGGGTFTPLGTVPPDLLQLGLTLDVAANQPELIYLSGFDDQGRGTLAKSTNRGQSFVGFTITGLGIAAPPYIAAVSALDPNRVFVRTDEFSRANDDFEARETADDSLYFTPDGGQTWHLALNKRGKLYGFALSPDERWVLAGYGDPVLPAIFVEPGELGLYRVALEDLVASPDAPPWERIYDPGVTCLRWTERGLFACVAQDQSGFEMGRAIDASFSLADPAPFEGLLKLPEVRPLECPAESAAAACLSEEVTGWLATCNVLRAQCSLDASDGDPGNPGEPGPVDPGATSGPPGDSTVPPRGSTSSLGTEGASSSVPSTEGTAGRGAPDSSTSGEGPTQPGDDGPRRAASGSCSSVPGPRGTAAGSASAWCLTALLLLAVRRREHRGTLRVSGAPGKHTQGARAERPPTFPRDILQRNAWLVALVSLGATRLVACSDDATLDGRSANATGDVSDPGAEPNGDCGGAGEDFVLGMSKTTPSGALTVAIVTAEPAPPLVGRNSWTVMLSDESGEAITAASVTLTGWMPRHGHGLSSVPLTDELDGGRYELQPINLFMPQLWEFGVGVTRNDDRDVVTFSFCVQ